MAEAALFPPPETHCFSERKEALEFFPLKKISVDRGLDIMEQTRIKVSLWESTSAPVHSCSISFSDRKCLNYYDSKAMLDRRNICSCWHTSLQVYSGMSIWHWGQREAFVFSVGRSWPFSATFHNTVSPVLLHFLSFHRQINKGIAYSGVVR